MYLLCGFITNYHTKCRQNVSGNIKQLLSEIHYSYHNAIHVSAHLKVHKIVFYEYYKGTMADKLHKMTAQRSLKPKWNIMVIFSFNYYALK